MQLKTAKFNYFYFWLSIVSCNITGCPKAASASRYLATLQCCCDGSAFPFFPFFFFPIISCACLMYVLGNNVLCSHGLGIKKRYNVSGTIGSPINI